MITLIFSDTHLTRRFEKRRFNYLKKIIVEADKVIINGDFWDGYFVDFDKFIKSRWSQLFPILKARETVYLYGNHDRREWCNEKVFLFSDKQAEMIKIKLAGKILRIEHGNKIVPDPGDIYPWIIDKRIRRIIAFFILIIGRVLLTHMGKKYLRKWNRRIKDWWKKQYAKNQILVCGHTHVAEFNLIARYINVGFIRYNYAHYLKIVDDKLELVEERYYRFRLPKLHSTAALSRFSKRQATFTGPTPPGTGV